MSSAGQLDRGRLEIRLGKYATAPPTALTDLSLLPRVQDYRRHVAGRMYPIGKEDIRRKIPPAAYQVSRKFDGEFTALSFQDGEAISVNPGGTVRVNLPWHQAAAEQLAAAGVRQALIMGELYVAAESARRPRVHDVVKIARHPSSEDELARLKFAAFDLVQLNGEDPPETFDECWSLLAKWFDDGELIHPVETKPAQDAAGIEKIFHNWVEKEGAEGVVARSDTAGMYKIKPRHNLDAAVIGFTEASDDRQGLLHDMLLAVGRSDESLHVLTRVGGGFSDDQRRELLSDLKDMTVDSEYTEVNSDHVAYQMVRPEWVVEISYLDLVSQTTRGAPVNRMVLSYDQQDPGYRVVRRLPLASVISPQFIRRREDKRVTPSDVRIAQVSQMVDVPLADQNAGQFTTPKSQMLNREVYVKEHRGSLMVRKFLLWETNKPRDGNDEFPKFVAYYTDFSSNRKTPLQRDIRVSDSREQIERLWNAMREKNIKAGWKPYEEDADEKPDDSDK
ncbi:MAG: hypothetical protein MPJ50_04425 [Pirellulales bacterium]|nr:hypothetical protein [Pirellulales bacterium]